jgi:hypothetical protein
MPIWRGNTYRFTVTAATAAAGDTYTNNGQTFTVTATITAATTLFCTGTGAPSASGILTRTSGTGDATITFSANVAPNVNWGTATNWDTGVIPSATLAGTDAIFDSASLDCTVNVAGVCRNLNFTGYTRNITMNNTITVGSTSAANPTHAVTLSSGMSILGTSSLIVRGNGVATITSNGKQWPNELALCTVAAATNPTIALADNWTTRDLTINPTTSVLNTTFSGAFTINVTRNLTLNGGNSTGSRVSATAGSVSTIKMTGAGTYSWTGVFGTGIGVNLAIDSGVNTVTIADGCQYGGSGIVSGTSTFSYISGTVTCAGTFYFLHTASAGTFTANLSGSSSTSATATSSSGVNFNNLDFRASGAGTAQTCAISNTICVVNTLSVTSTATNNSINTSGGTIYANGNVTFNGYSATTSSTILVMQNTGTLTQTPAFSALSSYGISWQIQINTTATTTIGSDIGIFQSGSLTYTAGAVVFSAGVVIRAYNQGAFYGFGSGSVIIPKLYHYTGGATGSALATIYFYDSVPIRITDLVLLNSSSNFAWIHGGTIGWTANNFSCSLNASTSNTSIALLVNKEYTVKTSVSLLAYAGTTNNFTLRASTVGTTIFTVEFGASQDLYYVNGGSNANNQHVNSANGQTVYTRAGTISTSTINWRNWDYPRTRQSTFIM